MSNKMIKLVKPYIAPAKEMLPAIENVLYSGYIAMGREVEDFEKKLGEVFSNKMVLALNSGTAALHIALELLDVGIGDEVISTAMTAEPTNTTIAMTGANVVWADVEKDTGLIDPQDIRRKITDKTKAIMVVHYAGMVCDMREINKISIETGIPVIEDAAHAFGAGYDGKTLGKYSRFVCYSFQAIKHMTTVDGGAITFANSSDYEEAKKLRWFGLDKSISRLENDIKRAGYKYGMNNVNATIGTVQLNHIDEVVERHKKNGRYYDNELKDIPGVNLVKYHEGTNPSYWLYTMKVDNRADFCRKLAERGIESSQLHHRNDTHSVFHESRCYLPGLDEWYSSFVHIPCGWWITKEDISLIVQTIREGW